MRHQRVDDDGEISREGIGIRIGWRLGDLMARNFKAAQRARRSGEARVDACQRAAVRFVLPVRGDVG